MKIAQTRSNFYSKLALATKETMANFRSRLASLYVTLVLVVIIQIVFVLITPGFADFINAHTPESISLYVTTSLVLLINFMVLVPILRLTVLNLMYLLRVFLDSERKAIAAGTGKPRPTLDRFLRFIMTVNNWFFIVLFDFAILFFTPNKIDILGHILVAVAGIAIIAFMEIWAYLRRS
jgi:hypothetical protein